jgi:hypothetical protein
LPQPQRAWLAIEFVSYAKGRSIFIAGGRQLPQTQAAPWLFPQHVDATIVIDFVDSD